MFRQKKENHQLTFGGQLNKNWVYHDLCRYQENFVHQEKNKLNLFTLLKEGFTNLPTKAPKSSSSRDLVGDLDRLKNKIISTFSYLKSIKTLSDSTESAFSTLSGTGHRKKKTHPSNFTEFSFLDPQLDKIILHFSSGKLLRAPSNSAIVDLAFSTIGGQKPKPIYSRKSIAGFKLTKGALLGAKVTLRNLSKWEFYYKWIFLGASESFKSDSKTKKDSQSFGLATLSNSSSRAIKNVFIFTELDKLDYDRFSNISGFEIQFLTLAQGYAKKAKVSGGG